MSVYVVPSNPPPSYLPTTRSSSTAQANGASTLPYPGSTSAGLEGNVGTTLYVGGSHTPAIRSPQTPSTGISFTTASPFPPLPSPSVLPRLVDQNGVGGTTTTASGGALMAGEKGNRKANPTTGKIAPHPPSVSAAPFAELGFTGATVPLSRHKAKLEECAYLHKELEKAKAELAIAKQQIHGSQRESNDILTEASRLHDVMNVLTSELSVKQKRVQQLELENKSMKEELSQSREDMELLTASRAVLQRKKEALKGVQSTTPGAAALGAREDLFYHQFSSEIGEDEERGDRIGGGSAAQVASYFPVDPSWADASGGRGGPSAAAVRSWVTSAALAPGAAHPISFMLPQKEEQEFTVVPLESPFMEPQSGDSGGRGSGVSLRVSVEEKKGECHGEEEEYFEEIGYEDREVEEEIIEEVEVTPGLPDSTSSLLTTETREGTDEEGTTPHDPASSPPPAAVGEKNSSGGGDGGVVTYKVSPQPIRYRRVRRVMLMKRVPVMKKVQKRTDNTLVVASGGSKHRSHRSPPTSTSPRGSGSGGGKSPTTATLVPIRFPYRQHSASSPAFFSSLNPRTHRPRDVNNELLLEYMTACFHHGCAPHVEVLRSLYRGDGMMVMSAPPISFEQLSVQVHLLRSPSPSLLSVWSGSHLASLSLRSADTSAGVPLLAAMLPALPHLEKLEVFAITTTAAMQRLVEAVSTTSSLRVLSLPQLGVKDEALLLLWDLLQRRKEGYELAEAKKRAEAGREWEEGKEAEDAVKRHEVRKAKQRVRRETTGSAAISPITPYGSSGFRTSLSLGGGGTGEGGKAWIPYPPSTVPQGQCTDRGSILHSTATRRTTAATMASRRTGSSMSALYSLASAHTPLPPHSLCEDTISQVEGPPHPSPLTGEAHSSLSDPLPPPMRAPCPLHIPILDLSHCQVEDPLTIKTICCPGVQVLFLAGLANAVTDVALHCVLKSGCPSLRTLDLSGCTRVTSQGLSTYCNRHDHLVVLRVEQCPQLRTLHLDHIQVLYSPLNFVHSLHMPALRRLPVPVENRIVLRDFSAPALEEVSFHGMMIGHHVLQPAFMFTEDERTRIQTYERDRYLAKECQQDAKLYARGVEAETEALRQGKGSAGVNPSAGGGGGGDRGAEEEGSTGSVGPASSRNPSTVASVAAKSSAAEEGEGGGMLAGRTSVLTSTLGILDRPGDLLTLLGGGSGEAGGPKAGGIPRTARRLALPPRLRQVSFLQCDFTDVKELRDFLLQQDQLTTLTLHRCTGVVDAHMQPLPKTLRSLDVAFAGSLSNAALRSIVTKAPLLTHLNLKHAGGGGEGGITKEGIQALYGLSWLQHLNLLGLSPEAVPGSVVSAVASSLPHLVALYHETAVVVGGGAGGKGVGSGNGGASAPGRPPFISTPSAFLAGIGEGGNGQGESGGDPLSPVAIRSSFSSPTTAAAVAPTTTSFLHVYRTDQESVWMKEVAEAPLQLLRLRHSAALKLWLESTILPPEPPSTLWPVGKAHTMETVAARANPALLYTPVPPCAWMAHHPIRPGRTPLYTRPEDIATILQYTGFTPTTTTTTVTSSPLSRSCTMLTATNIQGIAALYVKEHEGSGGEEEGSPLDGHTVSVPLPSEYLDGVGIVPLTRLRDEAVAAAGGGRRQTPDGSPLRDEEEDSHAASSPSASISSGEPYSSTSGSGPDGDYRRRRDTERQTTTQEREGSSEDGQEEEVVRDSEDTSAGGGDAGGQGTRSHTSPARPSLFTLTPEEQATLQRKRAALNISFSTSSDDMDEDDEKEGASEGGGNEGGRSPGPHRGSPLANPNEGLPPLTGGGGGSYRSGMSTSIMSGSGGSGKTGGGGGGTRGSGSGSTALPTIRTGNAGSGTVNSTSYPSTSHLRPERGNSNSALGVGASGSPLDAPSAGSVPSRLEEEEEIKPWGEGE